MRERQMRRERVWVRNEYKARVKGYEAARGAVGGGKRALCGAVIRKKACRVKVTLRSIFKKCVIVPTPLQLRVWVVSVVGTIEVK